MPVDGSGMYRMNPQQAPPTAVAPPDPMAQAAAPPTTVTISGQAGGPYQVDAGDGQPTDMPDFASAMQHASQLFGEDMDGDQDPSKPPTQDSGSSDSGSSSDSEY